VDEIKLPYLISASDEHGHSAVSGNERRIKRPTVHSFLDLEAQLEESNLPNLTDAAYDEIVRQIEEIFEQVYSDDQSRRYGFDCKWFSALLNRRWHSSMDAAEYIHARDRLLASLAGKSAKKQTDYLRNHNRRRHQSKSDLNAKMAYEFLEFVWCNPTSRLSLTALKEKIGKKYDKGRTASIDGINTYLSQAVIG
jgi:hypothetical protein